MGTYLRQILGVFSLLGAFALSALAQYYPPEFTNDQDKLSYLLFVEKHIPTLFEDKTAFDTDFLKLLDHEADFLKKIRQLPIYQELVAKQGPLLRIEVKEKASRVRKSQDLSALFLGALKQELQALKKLDSSSEVTSVAQLRASLEAQIEVALKNLNGASSLGIITGLIHCLPIDERGALFKLEPLEQLMQLAQSKALTRDALVKGFKLKDSSLNPKTITREELIELAKVKLDQEATFKRLLLLDYVLGTQLDSTENLEDIDLSDVPLDTKDTQAHLERLRGALKLNKTAFARAKSALNAIIEEKTSRPHGAEYQFEDSIVLQEMPSNLAIFRGFIAGDCSTQRSYGYSYSPIERTFFVYDREGKLRGYLAGTMLEANGEPVFYLHDVTGKFLTQKQSRQAVHALYASLKNLGGRHLIIATSDVIAVNMHFEHHKQILLEYNSGKNFVDLHFPDAALRSEISQILFEQTSLPAPYDDVERNSKGHYFTPNEDTQNAIQVSSEHKSNFRYKKTQVSKIHAILLAADFYQSNRTSTAHEVLNLGGVSLEEFVHFTNGLKNPEPLALSAYYQRVDALLGQYNLNRKSPEIKSRPYLFLSGHLGASDVSESINSEYKAQTIRYVIRSLDPFKPMWDTSDNPFVGQTSHKQKSLEIINHNLKAFEKSELFSNQIQKWMNFPLESETLIKELKELGFIPKHGLQDCPDLLEPN